MSMYQYLRRLMDIAEDIGIPDDVLMDDDYVTIRGHYKGFKEDTNLKFSLNLTFREEKKDGT